MTSENQLVEIDRKLERICAILNGPDGLVTKVELHALLLKNIPTPATLKWHAFLGGGIAMLFGIIGFSIDKMFR